MIVYHGTTMEIQNPNVSYSKKYLDFGRGFYVTTYKEQAERWAMRKSVRLEKEAVVNVYELDNINSFNVLDFQSDDSQWIDFVCASRKGSEEYKKYDIITGGVADDNVFKAVDMYARGLWDKTRVLQELKYYQKNNQICIVNQQVINAALKFKKSYKVGEYNG